MQPSAEWQSRVGDSREALPYRSLGLESVWPPLLSELCLWKGSGDSAGLCRTCGGRLGLLRRFVKHAPQVPVIQELSHRNGNLIEQIVNDQIAKRHRQQFFVQVRRNRKRDLRPIALLRLTTGQNGHGNPDKVERIPR